MMREGRLRQDQVPAATESIYRNAQIQKGLIDDLLDVSRITAWQLKLEIRSINVNEVIRQALDSVRFMAHSKKIQLNSVVEEPIGSVSGDERRLQQILWNLLTNAVKFTPEGGWINLHAHRRRREIEIQVRDNGQGMGSDFIPYAFDAFRQERDSTTRPCGGMGPGALDREATCGIAWWKSDRLQRGYRKGTNLALTGGFDGIPANRLKWRRGYKVLDRRGLRGIKFFKNEMYVAAGGQS
jgi:signal transduction histidine kinase